MKSNRATIVLAVLFFGGLCALWGLELAGVLTRAQRDQRAEYILPDVASVAEASRVGRVVIERGSERLVFERRGSLLDRWQMMEPVDVAAEPTRLETLVRQLRELRKSPDSGTIEGDPATFGFSPAAETIRLYGVDPRTGSTEARELGSLELGKVVRGLRYVRGAPGGGIEVVDARPLESVNRPAVEWRQPVLMGVPSFQVTSLRIRREGRTIAAVRGASGQWRLTEPVAAPANGAKVESLLAALASLRVVDGSNGFVANDVKDLGPFGLTVPACTVELKTREGSDAMVLQVGKAVPGQPDRVYVRQADQDDVVIVDSKALSEIPEQAVAFRSQAVTEFQPALVSQIEIKTRVRTFMIRKKAGDWEISTPDPSKADRIVIEGFLDHLDKLQTSEFFNLQTVREPRLDPALMTIKLWQSDRRAQKSISTGSAEPPGDVALSLQLGRHDVARKTIYARLENDSVVLALPDKMLEILPSHEYAFRDRTIVVESPSQVRKVSVRRGGRVDELEPATTGQPNRWRMTKPVEAQADTPSVTRMLAALSNFRVEEFVSGPPVDLKAFGLGAPLLEITWESDKQHTLKIGAAVAKSSTTYASLDSEPYVFTLSAEMIALFNVEFRDHRVIAFPAERAVGMTLEWMGRTLQLQRRSPVARGTVEWVPEGVADISGIDLSRIGSVVQTLSNLQTAAFFQYDGRFPESSGLFRPRLTITVSVGEGQPKAVLRIGSRTVDGQTFAAVGTGETGPVFFLPATAWDELIRVGERYQPIPDNPFAPGP